MGKFKQRSLYRETYERGAVKLLPDFLPVLRHCATATGKPFEAIGCDIMAAGVVQNPDGTKSEYQDLRVYIKPTE